MPTSTMPAWQLRLLLLLLLGLLGRLLSVRILSTSSSSSAHVAPGGRQVLGSIGVARLLLQGGLKVCYCRPKLALVGVCCPSCNQGIAAVGVELQGFGVTLHGLLVLACRSSGKHPAHWRLTGDSIRRSDYKGGCGRPSRVKPTSLWLPHGKLGVPPPPGRLLCRTVLYCSNQAA